MTEQETRDSERDAIVAWLRSEMPDRDNGGPCRHVDHYQGQCGCNDLADAIQASQQILAQNGDEG